MSEVQDQGLTLERKMGPEMDLVNRPNPWLPAYGFQLQPLHANYPNTHEDLRANEAMLAQQVDFLETILEETSDDLQSDSDRSGTTYWLGSDSETESVIHIKVGQRTADEKQDGSGSECNSVVPKKRRRRNETSDVLHAGAGSPRSSRDSSASSRSSSLLQFESLERTCATLSPSSYSFDSLEDSSGRGGTTSGARNAAAASNGASSRHEACASPDSLEHEDYAQLNGYLNVNGHRETNDGLFGRLRPYRSFESLGEKDLMMQGRDEQLGRLLTNGFAAHAFGKNCDLSRLARRPNSRRRDPWQHAYSDYDESTNDSPENLSSDDEDDDADDDDDDEDEEDYTSCRYTEVDQLLVFGDPSSTYSHAASLDCRNSVDLRECGLDSDDERTRRETTFLDLKAAARLSLSTRSSDEDEEEVDLEGIDPSVQLRRRRHHHHHHHHHHRSSGSGSGGGSLQYNSDARQSGAGSGSAGGGFNFRFTDKWRSAPSLPGSVAAASSTASVATSLLRYEAYTRVASVPVNLDLCGRSSRALFIDDDDNDDDDEKELPAKELRSSEERNLSDHEEDAVNEGEEVRMAEIVTMNYDGLTMVPEDDLEPGKVVGEEKARLKKRAKEQLSTAVKTQDSALSSEIINLGTPKNASMENDEVERKSPVLQTVKTQDKVESNEVLEIALAMEKDVDAVVDEAIRQLKREVEEAIRQNSANVEELAGALENARRARLENLQERRRVKNNASYELAQQNTVDEMNLRRRKLYNRESEESSPPRQRRVINNASYELALQYDYMKHLPIDRRFYRMDACEELVEPSSSSVSELVEKMSSTGSACNLSSQYHSPASTSPRQYSKSTENVSSGARNQAKQQRREETSLLDQIKKNSDFFSTSGEDAGKAASPATVLPALDDEVDYPCLLENKPIIVASSTTDKTTNLNNDVEATTRETVLENNDEEGDDDEGAHKKSFIGEFYRAASPKSALVSKSCEDMRSNGTLRSGDRLWGVVMEARTFAVEEEESSGTAATPPLLGSPESAAAAAGARCAAAAGSSPAALAEHDNNAVIVNRRIASDEAVALEEASTVQPRPSAEMSATAAKRLAMSGEPTTVKSPSSTSVNTLSTTTSKEERKKSGLGGFLQRFSKLRFSGRSKVPRSEVQKNKSGASAGVEHAVQNNSRLQQAAPGRKKNEPDYIIIPLHPPEDEIRRDEEEQRQQEQQQQQQQEANDRNVSNISLNGRPPACPGGSHKKPPLPPQSLRGAAASSSISSSSSSSAGISSTSSYGFGGVGVPQAPSRRRAATDLGNPAAIEMAKARAAMLAASSSSTTTVSQEPSQQQRPLGLLETDLDAPDEEAAAASKKARSLLNLNGHHHHHHHHPQHQQVGLSLSIADQSGAELEFALDDEDAVATTAKSPGGGAANHLSHRHHHHNGQHHHHHHRGKAASEVAAGHQRPHKSMEFLLDKENLHFVKPPENELQKVGERVPSEHELRVQRSLQRLNVPDWYKNSPAARDGGGFRLKRHSDASQHGGWRALGSKTTSLSSLSSSSNRQPATAGTLLSPSPTPPVFSRWSTSLLNSAGSSPASSARSSFNHRQPYLGWRSQERLANPRTPAERLAQGILPQLQHANKQQQQQQSASAHQQCGPQAGATTTNQEVRNSIKEVTSAIVHYVQSGQEVVGGGGGGGRLSPRPRPDDLDDRGGARSTSPRGSTRLVWMESSFVGVRPVEAPDTPPNIAVPQQQRRTSAAPASPSRSSLLDATLRSGGETSEDGGGSTPGLVYCPDDGGFVSLSGGSSSLFLDLAATTAAASSPRQQQLPELPQDHRHRQRRHRRPDRESPSPTHQQHQSRQRHRAEPEQHQRAESLEPQQQQQQQQRPRPPLQRRRSEGSDSNPPPRSSSRSCLQLQHHHQHKHRHRRVSFDAASSSSLDNVKQEERIVRCRNSKCTNSSTLAEARRSYKSCHNCTCLYCSRECRRAHWQRHRRTCLYSRASSLCIQVLSSVKKDPTSLKHASILARRGFAAHGRGAVKCFFASPEAAEKFIQAGFMELGEPTYVRWTDILPSEMGAELYAEAVRLCESYNPESRLVLYVSVCVVREVPSSRGGTVMWERQPVSRCAKLRLEASCRESQPVNNTSSSTSAMTSPQQTRASPTNITREMESPETLVLISSPMEDGSSTPRRIREIGFGNIQKQLKQRGVSLGRHFPQVYGKLSAYVDGTVEKFAPVTIYPRDQATGRCFMCIIMLDAEPERMQLLPTDSSRLKTVDINVEHD